MKLRKTYILAFLAVVQTAGADQYALTFDKTDRVLNWNHSVDYKAPQGSRPSFSIAARLGKRVSGGSRYKSQTDTRSLSTETDFDLTRTVSLGMKFSTSSSRQKSDFGDYDLSSTDLRSVLNFSPFTSLNITQSLGRSYDKRQSISDAGLAHATSIRANPFHTTLGNHGISWKVNYSMSTVSSEQGDSRDELSSTLSWNHDDVANTRFHFSGTRDNIRYVSIRNFSKILARNTSNRVVSGSADGRWHGLAKLDGSVTYSVSEIGDDASSDSTDLGKYLTNNRSGDWRFRSKLSSLWTQFPSIVSSVDYMRGTRTADANPANRDRINELDTRTRRLKWRTSGQILKWERDTLGVAVSLAIDRRHTPALEEINDRDQFSRDWSIRYSHRFTHTVSMVSTIAVSEAHAVYLDSLKSANNRWIRRTNIVTELKYRLGRLKIGQEYMFSGDKETYDYDEINAASPKSRQTFRARVKNFVFWKASRHLDLDVSYIFHARTRGSLFLAAIETQPAGWNLEGNEMDHNIGAGFAWRPSEVWQLRPHATYIWQGDYSPTSTVWNPWNLGDRIRRIRNLNLNAKVSYDPNGQFLGGGNSLVFEWTRSIRWLTDRAVHRDLATVVFIHAF